MHLYLKIKIKYCEQKYVYRKRSKVVGVIIDYVRSDVQRTQHYYAGKLKTHKSPGARLIFHNIIILHVYACDENNARLITLLHLIDKKTIN